MTNQIVGMLTVEQEAKNQKGGAGRHAEIIASSQPTTFAPLPMRERG